MIWQMIQRHRVEACAVCVAILIAACTQGQDPAATPARDVTNRPSTPQPRKGGSAASEVAVAARAVVAETLAYAEVDDRLVKGHFVFPQNMVDPLPAVILIHEWWGLNNVTRNIADRIASEGFIVLAIDLYGSQTATSPAQARQLMLEVVENPQFATQNIQQACEWVLTTTGATQVATVGFGFGGGWSLSAAMTLPGTIDASVIYYGQVSDNEEALAPLDTPILGLFGDADTAIPVESVTGFENALLALSKDFEIDVYPGAGSGFATPGHRNFDEKLAKKAWAKMVSFLHLHLPVES